MVGDGLLQLTVGADRVFLRDGEAIIAELRGAVSRIAPARGLHMLGSRRRHHARRRVRILGTALAQGVLMAIRLYIVGIQVAPLLGLLTFFLASSGGPAARMIPTGLWLSSRKAKPRGASSSGVRRWSCLRQSTMSETDDHQPRSGRSSS